MQEQVAALYFAALYFVALQKVASESSPDWDSIMQSLTSLALIGAAMHTICAHVAKMALSLTLLHFFDLFFGEIQPALLKVCLVSPSNTLVCKHWVPVVLTAGVELLEGRVVYYWQRLWHLQQDPSWHRHPCASPPLPPGAYSSFRLLSLDSFMTPPVRLTKICPRFFDDQPSWAGLYLHQNQETSYHAQLIAYARNKDAWFTAGMAFRCAFFGSMDSPVLYLVYHSIAAERRSLLLFSFFSLHILAAWATWCFVCA